MGGMASQLMGDGEGREASKIPKYVVSSRLGCGAFGSVFAGYKTDANDEQAVVEEGEDHNGSVAIKRQRREMREFRRPDLSRGEFPRVLHLPLTLFFDVACHKRTRRTIQMSLHSTEEVFPCHRWVPLI